MASLYSPRLVPLFTEGAASARKGPQLPPAEGNRAGLGGMASALLQMNVKNCTFTPLVAREEALLQVSPPSSAVTRARLVQGAYEIMPLALP